MVTFRGWRMKRTPARSIAITWMAVGVGYPDPASRFQPDGPHGPSQVVDPRHIAWTDGAWRGIAREGQVLYEMHIGTFTREGTWRRPPRTARARLAGHHRDRNDAGRGFRRALRLGLRRRQSVRPNAVVRRPTTCAGSSIRPTRPASASYSTSSTTTSGRTAIISATSRATTSPKAQERLGRSDQLRRETPAPVREFFIANAGYWIDEFHLDGLRLDATQAIFDDSPRAHSRRDRTRARGMPRRPRRSSSSPRTSRSTRGSSGHEQGG